MVKRAGIMDSPETTIRPQEVGSLAEATSQISKAWGAIADTTTALRQKMQPMLNEQAKEQAGKAAQAGDYRQRWTLNDQDAAYNAAIQSAYLANAQNDVDSNMARIHRDNPDDVEGYSKAFDEFRAGYMEKVPPAYAQAVGEYIDRQATRGKIDVADRRQEMAITSGLESLKSRLEVLDARYSETVFAEKGAKGFQEWSDYQEQRAQILKAMANPLYHIPTDVLEENRQTNLARGQLLAVNKSALGLYQDGGANAESAQRALDYLRENYGRTDLAAPSQMRDSMMGEARRQIMQAESARKAAESQARTEMRLMQTQLRVDVREDLDGLKAMSGAGQIVPDEVADRIVSNAEASGSSALVRDARSFQADVRASNALRGQSFEEMAATIDGWAQKANEGDDNAALMVGAGTRVMEEWQALAARDPLQYRVQSTGERPPELASDGGFGARAEYATRAANDVGSQAGFASDGSMVAYVHRGQRVYFTPAEKRVLAGISDNGGDAAYDVARRIITEVPDIDVAREMFREIGSSGVALGAAGELLLRTGDDEAARRILLGQRLLTVGKANGYTPAPLKIEDRQAAVESQIPRNVMAPEEVARVKHAADLMFEALAKETGRDDTSTYREAVRAVLGQREVNGRRYGGRVSAAGGDTIAPSFVRSDAFDRLIASLTMADYAAASGTQALPFKTVAGRRVPATIGDLRNTFPVPSDRPGVYYLAASATPGPRGFVLTRDANGQPFELDLNRIRADLARRRPDAVLPGGR